MKIVDVRSYSKPYIPGWGNTKKYIAVHYLGVAGQNNKIDHDGCGAHYYIYYDGTVYNAADANAILYQVGTAGYYTQKHPYARNANTIGIEICPKCDGTGKYAEDPKWYFTTESQNACVELVQKLMKDFGIPVSNVLRHYDIVNKYCPAPYVTNNKYKTSWTWSEFKSKLTATNSEKKQTQGNVVINTNEYYVNEGDTITSIASRMGVSASVLVAYNGITNPDNIRIGQKIKNPHKNSSNTYLFNPSTIMLGSKGTSVLLLQEILKARGFYTGNLDRISGSGTINAINSYQSLRRKQGKEIGTNGKNDSSCGSKMWEDLLAISKQGSKYMLEPVAVGSKGTSVLLLQEILKARGFYTGNLDQEFDAVTMRAVNSYQKLRKSQGTTIGNGAGDGICGSDMWKDLIAI